MTAKDKPFKHVLIVGCGDIGLRVAKIWKNAAKSVFALARTEESIDTFRQQHLFTCQADLDDFQSLKDIPSRQSLLYYFAPPPAKGHVDTRMANFLASMEKETFPAHLVYISTSGVYGDQGGELINEDSPVNPTADRAKRRYNAEQQLRTWSKQTSVPITILRVGGIYGPGRLPLQRLKDQIPMLHEELSPQTNRIHADDLAQVCVAAAADKAEGEIYNVSDGTNSNMTEYFNTIADYCDLPRPPLVDWEEAEKTISKGMLSYLKESRRLDNSKMINELGIELIYPTLKDGLESCHE
ncbi:MAG: SDR family oxidoreductase [Gammaproteobacteria bacterium]|nr:SDR family oxidoreductase [Gammaproteobacteria bacterium]